MVRDFLAESWFEEDPAATVDENLFFRLYHAWCVVDQRPELDEDTLFGLVERAGYSRFDGEVWGIGLSNVGEAMMMHAYLQPNENRRVFTEGDYTLIVEKKEAEGYQEDGDDEYPISDIEGRILCCVAGKLSTSEIAGRLRITEKEVETHLRAIYDQFAKVEGGSTFAALILSHWHREVS